MVKCPYLHHVFFFITSFINSAVAVHVLRIVNSILQALEVTHLTCCA